MTELVRLTELELVPVVELPAWRFSERPLPEGPSRDHRETWQCYWLECLADAGITDLRPIEPGSMHAAVSAFSDLGSLARVVARDGFDPRVGSAAARRCRSSSPTAIRATPPRR